EGNGIGVSAPKEQKDTRGLPIYSDEVKVKLEKEGLLQLYELPYFGNPECLYQWMMSCVKEDKFDFTGHKIRITPQLISKFTGLICEGDNIDDDLSDKEAIKATVTAYDYKKGSWYFYIVEIPYPIMRMVMCMVTKLNDQERWTQVNKALLNVCIKISEGIIYIFVAFIPDEIIRSAQEGDKI
ncbi:hypothetical protein KI387_017081, partial [Taxus chinensis]